MVTPKSSPDGVSAGGGLKVSTLQGMDSGGRAVALYREFGDERDVTRGCSCLR